MSNKRNLDAYAEMFFDDEEFDLDYPEEADSDICPYCGQPMIDDVEVGQGYHITPPCWMLGSGDHEALKQWLTVIL